MRIAVIGATGVAGRVFTTLAIEAGHALAVYRNGQRADIFSPPELSELVDGCDAVVNLATAIPAAGTDWTMNDRIRREGTFNVILACIARNVPVLLQQSVAMLNCVSDEVPQDEEDAIKGYSFLQSAFDMETIANASPLDVRLVRGGLFYGPGTGRHERWLEELRTSQFRIPGDGRSWVSPVHVQDYARALLAVLTLGAPRGTYIACDDMPMQLGALYAGLAARAGLPVPASGGPQFIRSFRTSNRKLRALGWRPVHAVMRD